MMIKKKLTMGKCSAWVTLGKCSSISFMFIIYDFYTHGILCYSYRGVM